MLQPPLQRATTFHWDWSYERALLRRAEEQAVAAVVREAEARAVAAAAIAAAEAAAAATAVEAAAAAAATQLVLVGHSHGPAFSPEPEPTPQRAREPPDLFSALLAKPLTYSTPECAAGFHPAVIGDAVTSFFLIFSSPFSLGDARRRLSWSFSRARQQNTIRA